MGEPDIVQNLVAAKAIEIIADVDKVKVVSDPFIHFRFQAPLLSK